MQCVCDNVVMFPCALVMIHAYCSRYRSMRVKNATHDFLFAEFTDVTVAADWSYPPSGIQFFEYYDMRSDPFQLHNLWHTTPLETQQILRDRLQELFTCQGNTCP